MKSPKTPWKECPGGICAPLGFRASAQRAGLKKQGLDLVLISSDQDASAAACFTRNEFPAAPVLVSREHLKQSRGRARAILVNSGGANAATGPDGLVRARQTVHALARLLGLPRSAVLVSSTGVIGAPLDSGKIIATLPSCVAHLNRSQGEKAAEAICTTDTVTKIESLELKTGKDKVRIGGIAKGAGMIHPDMATMLAFITTDVRISPSRLQRNLNWCVERSFNCITVDGDTSTNDTVLVLANGSSGVDVARLEDSQTGKTSSKSAQPSENGGIFVEALLEVCRRLARKIAWDGEGATHHLEITVTGGRSFEQARKVGRSIGRSNLVKTAIYGHDPNWGRVLSAAGAAGEKIDASRVTLRVDGKIAAAGGIIKNVSDAVYTQVWTKKKIRIDLDLGMGDASAVCWSCDLSHAYVDINGSYRT